MLDCQIAAVFELRSFPEYFDVTGRILKGLIEEWSEKKDVDRLIREMRSTVELISRR